LLVVAVVEVNSVAVEVVLVVIALVQHFPHFLVQHMR
jgi:hypothetical protein